MLHELQIKKRRGAPVSKEDELSEVKRMLLEIKEDIGRLETQGAPVSKEDELSEVKRMLLGIKEDIGRQETRFLEFQQA